MRTIAIPVLAALVASCQATASIEDDEGAQDVWVTIGSDAALAVESSLSGAVIETREAEAGVSVVKLPGAAIPELTHFMHAQFRRCGGYMVHESPKQAAGQLDSELTRAAVLKAFTGYTIDNSEVAETLLGQVEESNLVESIAALSSFPTRFYTSQGGVDGAHWIREQLASAAQDRSDVTVELFQHAGFPQPSVILTIPGGELADEVVVLGAHLDSTAFGSGGRAPGADDDASGVATLIEVARVALANGYRPARTIKFIGYAAEEVGLRGSREIAALHKAQSVNVVGVLQLDMTNYKGSDRDIYLVDDHTNAEQNQFVGRLIDTYLGLSWDFTTCGYGCSDHASWTQVGYPASIPFESRTDQYNPRIHTAGDTLEVSGGNAEHGVKFARLAAAYLAEMGKGDFGGGGEPPPSPPPPAPEPVTETFSGSPAQGQELLFGPFETVAGAAFTAAISGTGDADLYVHIGAPPTRSTYTCRPFRSGSDESCNLTVPAGQSQVYVMLHGFRAATFELTVAYSRSGESPGNPAPEPPAGTPTEVTETFSGAVAETVEDHYGPFAVVPGTRVSAVLTPRNGSPGDADLYLRPDRAPTTGSYACRPYLTGSSERCDLGVPAGTTEAYVMVRGYTAAEYDLEVTYAATQ